MLLGIIAGSIDLKQLPLTIHLPQQRHFDNYYVCHDALMIVNSLKLLIQQDSDLFVVGIQGSQGAGKSHLLEAVCHLASDSVRCVYIPLASCISWSPHSVLEDLHRHSLVCIDDVDLVFNDPEWQQALFHFYNRLIDSGGRLVFSTTAPLAKVKGVLPDLLSRLKMALNFILPLLNDDDMAAALRLRAADFGVELSDDVINYLLTHTDRNMPALVGWLERLDVLSLAKKRKPSIPLLKQLMQDADYLG